MKSAIATICLSLLCATPAVTAERTLVHEAVIAAPVAEVWAAFTTNEGFESWAVSHAEIDLRVGGDMRTSYVAESNLNDEHTIVNRILAFEPQRMLSIQNVRAPAGFAHAELFQQTWSVIHFEPVGHLLTRVRVTGMGYGEGLEWDEIFRKFEAGNSYTLRKLQERFADRSRSDDDDRVLELLHQLVGGEWIHKSTAPDGSVFRVRNVIEAGPDGRSLVSRGWLGDAEGMIDHGPTMVWRAPPSDGGGIWYCGIDQNGGVSSGRITLLATDTVQWDWNFVSTNGEKSHYRVEHRFIDEDHYHMRILKSGDASEEQEIAAAMFERVAAAPQEFTTLHPPADEPSKSAEGRAPSSPVSHEVQLRCVCSSLQGPRHSHPERRNVACQQPPGRFPPDSTLSRCIRRSRMLRRRSTSTRRRSVRRSFRDCPAPTARASCMH